MSIRYGRLNTKAIRVCDGATAASRGQISRSHRRIGQGRPIVAPRRRAALDSMSQSTSSAPRTPRARNSPILRARASREAGGDPLIVDVGTRAPSIAVDVTAAEVAAHRPAGAGAVLGLRRPRRGGRGHGRGFRALRSQPATTSPASSASAAAAAPRSSPPACATLPIGVPKLMVSTLASGDVAPYVGVSDIVMMPSVTDIAGLNRISRVGAGATPRTRSSAWPRAAVARTP